MPDRFPPPPPGGAYTPEQRDQALRLAEEVGPWRAAKQLGIGYLTVRRWIDPEYREQERRGDRRRRRAPCERCNRPTNVYGRQHPEFGLLCRSCLATALADQRRGWTTDELVDMYESQLMSTTEIASMTGSTQSAVYAVLARRGVAFRSGADAVKLHPGGQPEHGKVDPEEIRELYEHGLSVTRIASEIACSTSAVLYHLKKLGLVA
jgi:transposase